MRIIKQVQIREIPDLQSIVGRTMIVYKYDPAGHHLYTRLHIDTVTVSEGSIMLRQANGIKQVCTDPEANLVEFSEQA